MMLEMAMVSRTWKLFIFCSFAVFEVICTSETSRTLETSILCPYYDFCNNEHKDVVNLAYTRAQGANDTLHYLYSTYGIPTVLVVQTDVHGNLIINWEELMVKDFSECHNCISFTTSVHYSYAVLIKTLIEYNDVNDTANLEDAKLNGDPSLWIQHDLSTLKWINATATSNLTLNEIVFKVSNETEPDLFHEGGSLQLTLRAYGMNDRNSKTPHLAYTANTTQFDVAINNMTVSFNNSRFALELMMVANWTGVTNGSKAHLVPTYSIDDEHSPGVFEIIDWTSEGNSQSHGGYIQWKPVCYTSPSRSFADLNRAKHYTVKNTTEIFRNNTIAYAFFGADLFTDAVSFSSSNVSFGLSKDNFFTATNYTVWSASFGMGMPPEDSISPMIILIISLGLGLPVIFIIFGGIGVIIKKRKEMATSYSSIN